MSNLALTFNETQFDIIDHNGQPWIRLSQIATALGYGQGGYQTDTPLRTLYTRHADEFTDSMTALVKLPTEGGEQEVRIFSLRGCHLLAMFARTPVAKEFRKWVLDVLERLGKEQQAAPGLELPPSDQNIIQALVKSIVDRHPEYEPKALYMQIWMRFRNHFRLGSYKQLPQEKMAEAVAYLASLKISEKRAPAKKQELPPAYVPLAERGRETMERLMALRRDISRTSISIMEVMQYATHHGNEPALDDTQLKFSRELGSSVCTFFMCINNNLIAVEHMYRAFCEAEKLIYG